MYYHQVDSLWPLCAHVASVVRWSAVCDCSMFVWWGVAWFLQFCSFCAANCSTEYSHRIIVRWCINYSAKYDFPLMFVALWGFATRLLEESSAGGSGMFVQTRLDPPSRAARWVRLYIFMHIDTCVYICGYLYTCLWMRMRMFACVYTFVHVCAYLHSHTYLHA